MTKAFKKALKEISYYTKIPASRYKGVKGKAWKLISEYTRMRDWIKWKKCVSCGKFIKNWRETDAGHFISMSGHGALSGFNTDNVHMQCKGCNMFASQSTGGPYEKEIERRGINVHILHEIKNMTVKSDDWFFLDKIQQVYFLFTELKKEFPNEDYPIYL